MVITSGANKVDRKRKLRDLLGFKPKIASASYVLKRLVSNLVEFHPLATGTSV